MVSSILYHWPARSKAIVYHRLVRWGRLLTTFQKGSALNFSSGVLSAHCSVTHLRTISRDSSRFWFKSPLSKFCFCWFTSAHVNISPLVSQKVVDNPGRSRHSSPWYRLKGVCATSDLHQGHVFTPFGTPVLPALIAALCSSLSGTPVRVALIFALRVAFVASLIVCSRTIAASLSFCRVSSLCGRPCNRPSLRSPPFVRFTKGPFPKSCRPYVLIQWVSKRRRQ